MVLNVTNDRSSTLNDLLNDNPTVSVEDAARILSVSRGQVYAMVKDGELKSVSIGSRISIPTKQLRFLIDGTR